MGSQGTGTELGEPRAAEAEPGGMRRAPGASGWGAEQEGDRHEEDPPFAGSPGSPSDRSAANLPDLPHIASPGPARGPRSAPGAPPKPEHRPQAGGRLLSPWATAAPPAFPAPGARTGR